jgi:hypothetical protein
MGCQPSKIRSSLTPDNDRQVIGSTQLQANQIVCLGNSVYLPIDENGESAIIEVEVKDKSIRVYRGYRNQLIRSGIS